MNMQVPERVVECAYFDITDIVRYAQANDRVAGIQRVQSMLIAHLAAKHGDALVKCVFHHPRLQRMVVVDPASLFGVEGFDAVKLLQQLDLDAEGGRWPARRRVKMVLRSSSTHKWKRALKKLEIYASAAMWPSRLAALDLQPRARLYEALPLTAVDVLPANAPLVVLSAHVLIEPVASFASGHRARGGDVVQLMHDLIAHNRPDFFTPRMVSDYEAWLARMVEIKPRVACVSQSTACDLRAFLGERAADWSIGVVPLAHEFSGSERNASGSKRPAFLPNGSFVLCVGTLEVRKNGLLLLEVWSRLVADLGDGVPTLVFAGAKGWLIEPFMDRLVRDPRLSGRVHVAHGVSDKDLSGLYEHCAFAVYPSHYEGWGLPVGEAVWFGKYVIASDTSSVPEVCADLIDYADPADVDAWVAALRRAIEDAAYVRAREQAIRRAPLRRWADVADDLYQWVRAPASAQRLPALTRSETMSGVS